MSELLRVLADHNKPETPEYFPDPVTIEGLSDVILDDLIADCFNVKREMDRIIDLAIAEKEKREQPSE